MKRELLLAVIALSLTGCATVQANNTRAIERMLVAAGFQERTADTPEKVAHLQALTPGKILRRDRNGETFYMYVDRNLCKCLYVGTEQQYQEFRKLVRQQRMADEATIAAEESRPEGNWGLSGLWP